MGKIKPNTKKQLLLSKKLKEEASTSFSVAF